MGLGLEVLSTRLLIHLHRHHPPLFPPTPGIYSLSVQCGQLQAKVHNLLPSVCFIHHWHMHRHFNLKSYYFLNLSPLTPSILALPLLFSVLFSLRWTEFPKSDGGFLKKAYAFTTALLSDALSTRWGSDSKDLTRTTRGDPCIDTGTGPLVDP